MKIIKRILKYFFALLGSVLVVAIIYLSVTFPPIMSGMAAKTMCSCVFVMGRTPESVREKELSVVPGLASADIQIQDSLAVTAKILWSTSKAIYREGLGCTLIAQRSEEQIRAQKIVPARPPALDQDTIAWPAGDRLSETKPALNAEILNSAVEDAFRDSDPEKPRNTLAVVVVYDGQIVAEKYANGFDKNSRLLGWSMTKSLTNGIIGTLVKSGKLDLSKPAPIAEWQSDERKNITLNDLMHASSGLEWNESYFLPGDFHNMFMHSDDKGGYAASKKAEFKPNEVFEYSSGTTNLVSKIIRQTVGDSAYYSYPYENLFYKIGMYHAIIEPDASGTFVGSSYGYATARDWARYGMLFLNDGVWNGERILPEGWVKYSSTPAPAAKLGQYGAQWWLNAGAKDNPAQCYHPGLPNEEYGAEGFEGQYVFIIPSKKLVVVRLGVSHHYDGKIELMQKILTALP